MALANTVVDAAPPSLLSPHATAFSYLAADDWFAEPHVGACCIPAARSADRLTSAAGMGALAPVSAVSWSFPAFRKRFDWLDACVTT